MWSQFWILSGISLRLNVWYFVNHLPLVAISSGNCSNVDLKDSFYETEACMTNHLLKDIRSKCRSEFRKPPRTFSASPEWQFNRSCRQRAEEEKKSRCSAAGDPLQFARSYAYQSMYLLVLVLSLRHAVCLMVRDRIRDDYHKWNRKKIDPDHGKRERVNEFMIHEHYESR